MSTDDLAAEVAGLLDRLPRIKITPETIRQTTIDQWYQREERYRDEIGQLRDELAETQADLAIVQGSTTDLIDTIRKLAAVPAEIQRVALNDLAANLMTYLPVSVRAGGTRD